MTHDPELEKFIDLRSRRHKKTESLMEAAANHFRTPYCVGCKKRHADCQCPIGGMASELQRGGH